MQPYLFPYIGYWQLINAVDIFVVLDDVSYIKKGYINRNSILINGNAHLFTIPLCKASQNKLIMDTKLNFPDKEKDKLIATLEYAYKKAPYFSTIMPIIHEIIYNQCEDLTEYICKSIKDISDYLGFSTMLLKSSEIEKESGVKAQDRIITICRKLNADEYINPCGGRKLYSQEIFENYGIKLLFLHPQMQNIVYSQFKGHQFVEALSILDILMFNSIDCVKRFLDEYELVV